MVYCGNLSVIIPNVPDILVFVFLLLHSLKLLNQINVVCVNEMTDV